MDSVDFGLSQSDFAQSNFTQSKGVKAIPAPVKAIPEAVKKEENEDDDDYSNNFDEA